ncbi:hypothetical protein ACS0TY_014591 [Phlomoides rotata]
MFSLYYLTSVSVQWKRMPTSNEPPAARVYARFDCDFSSTGMFPLKSQLMNLWKQSSTL